MSLKTETNKDFPLLEIGKRYLVKSFDSRAPYCVTVNEISESERYYSFKYDSGYIIWYTIDDFHNENKILEELKPLESTENQMLRS